MGIMKDAKKSLFVTKMGLKIDQRFGKNNYFVL